MTAPPLPASPCVRVRLDYSQTDGFNAGSRFYLSYSESAPSGGNCATLASDIASLWETYLSGTAHPDYALVEVDVLDIATDSGLSGQWEGNHAGSAGGNALPGQCCLNVEFDISRRYRGGKPRMYFPPSGSDNQLDAAHWQPDVLPTINTAFSNFFGGIAALSIGTMGTLAHVNLSYYKGFTNIANSSGRERAVPTYRNAALLDTVVGYSAKGVIGSQRRRRIATTY